MPAAPISSSPPAASRSGRPSKRRFEEYRRDLFTGEHATGDRPAGAPRETAGAERRRKNLGPRARSAKALLSAFWSQVRGHRGAILFSLTTLTVGTLLGLVPPAATKFVIDSVLGDTPLPEIVTDAFTGPLTLPTPDTPAGRVNCCGSSWGRCWRSVS